MPRATSSPQPSRRAPTSFTAPPLNSCATTISTPTTTSPIVPDGPEPHFTRTSLVESLADRSGTTEFSSSAITRDNGSPSSLAVLFRVYPPQPCGAATFQASLRPSSTRGHGTLDRVETAGPFGLSDVAPSA